MQKLNKKHFFLAGLFLAILPYCYLSFFTNPSSDDFGFAFQSQNNEMLHLIKQTYLYYNGRYISNIFIYLNPIAFGSFFGYKIVSFLIVVIFLFSNFFFVKELFYKKSKRTQVIISLTLSLLFIHNMPIISEGFYWFTGSVIYLLGIIAVQFYVVFLIRIIRKNKKGVSAVFLTTILFLACGFNEVLTLLIVFFLAVGSAIFYKRKLTGKNLMLIQFIFSILFAAVMIFSPGNEYRQVAYQNAHNFSHSFFYSVLQIGRFSFIWVVSIPLIAASFLYFQLNKKIENKLFKNSFYLNRWASLLMLFVITFICVFPAYWATGILGQHRTLNVAYFFFLIMWFVNLTVWYNYYQNKLRFSLTNKITTTLSVFLIAGLFLTANGYNALFDIFSGAANTYNEQLTERFANLEKAKNQEEKLAVPPLTEHPKCLFVSDITTDPKDWTNLAYNQYFKIEEKDIVLDKK